MRLLILAALALSACGPTYGPVGDVPIAALEPAPPPPPAGKCGVSETLTARYRGQLFTPSLGAQIQRQAGAARLRGIRPGDAVTMDYREDRLNIELDDDKVRILRCG